MPAPAILKLLVAVVCVLLPTLLTGCSAPKTDLFGSWVLESFERSDAPMIPPPGETRPRLTLEPPVDSTKAAPGEVRVSGFAGVNRFFGTGRLGSSDSIAVGSLGVTRMAGPSPLMALERVFIGIVQMARTVKVTGDTLVISGTAGGATLTRALDDDSQIPRQSPRQSAPAAKPAIDPVK